MAKSLYSLIINDEVIQNVDRMARLNGLSRSLMVEKILAEAVSLETPEIRANNIFEEIERLINVDRQMRYLEQPSTYMASIMSALDYRYNPAIKYSVELFPSSNYLGQLKVNLRTTNPVLINYMTDFYRLYTYLEKKYYNENAKYVFDGIKFVRLFNFPTVNITTKELAEVLTVYVKDFDELLSVYFSLLTDESKLLYAVEKKFIELKKEEIII